MINQLFDNFERSEFSDEIFSIFGRALTVATRFDASIKTLARLPLFKLAIVSRSTLSDDEYKQLVQNVSKKYSNLSRAIESLKLNEDISDLLTHARESRNELVHEATLGFIEGFDSFNEQELFQLLDHVKGIVLNVIKGERLISTIISIQNNEPISNYQFSHDYESKYVNWVMERFEKE